MAQGNIELTWWPLFRDFVGNVLPLAVSFCTTCQQSEPAAGLHVLHLLAGSAGILHVQPDDCSLGGGPYDTEIVGCFASYVAASLGGHALQAVVLFSLYVGPDLT